MPAICYRYGLLPPSPKDADKLRGIMRAANRYYNTLIEIARDKRERKQQARRERFPDIDALETKAAELEAEIERIRTLWKAANARKRQRTDQPKARLEIAAQRAELKEVRATLKQRRAEVKADADLLADWDAIDADCFTRSKAARANCGIYWGTYLLIEEAVDQAEKTSKKGPPRFRAWNGGGRIGVQVQGGVSVEEAFAGEDTRLRIDDFAGRENADRLPRSHRLTKLRMRIGSVGRDPIWQEFRLIYHRPLPPEARIKLATVHMRKVGKREVWSLTITLVSEAGFAKPDTATTGEVGVDVGWRSLREGLRVACWAGSDGATGELVLPDRWLTGWDRLKAEQGERDRQFNLARDRLADWLGEHEAPEWLANRLKTLAQWRSADRLWRIICNPARPMGAVNDDGSPIDWRNGRFPGDEEIFAYMLSWWRDERRAHTCIEGLRRKLIAQRTEAYRLLACQLRRKYATVKVEQVRWADMLRTPQPEEQAKDGALGHYRPVAAPHLLIQTLLTHAHAMKVPAANTTRLCFECGRLTEIEGEHIMQTCQNCGAMWDQDHNAAQNILHAASEEVAEPVE